jgi:hypothetical protein
MAYDTHESHESHGGCPLAADRAVDVDVSWLVPADLFAVDALARLHVVAARRGYLLRLRGADDGLAELVELVGLGDVLHLCPCSGADSPP